jgi:hypothetical protein
MERDWHEVVEAVGRAEAFGTVGVTIEGPDGRRWSRHGDRRFRAASVVKLPLMIEVYRRVEAETLRLARAWPTSTWASSASATSPGRRCARPVS